MPESNYRYFEPHAGKGQHESWKKSSFLSLGERKVVLTEEEHEAERLAGKPRWMDGSRLSRPEETGR